MSYDANTYWGRQGLERAILDALAATGKDVGKLTIDDLAPADQFHSGGKSSTVRLARLAGLKPGMGDALTLDTGGSMFDIVWTQNSGMNIGDKERLYAGFARVLRPGGLLAFQEPMAGPVQPPIFPVMWAPDATTNFLRAPDAMRAMIEAAGFRATAWDDVTAELAGPSTGAAVPAHAIQRIVMGNAVDEITRAGKRNRDEGRIVMIQAVLVRA